jgi:hypothetical protein
LSFVYYIKHLGFHPEKRKLAQYVREQVVEKDNWVSVAGSNMRVEAASVN